MSTYYQTGSGYYFKKIRGGGATRVSQQEYLKNFLHRRRLMRGGAQPCPTCQGRYTVRPGFQRCCKNCNNKNGNEHDGGSHTSMATGLSSVPACCGYCNQYLLRAKGGAAGVYWGACCLLCAQTGGLQHQGIATHTLCTGGVGVGVGAVAKPPVAKPAVAKQATTKKTYRVFSYNVSYESMLGKAGWGLCDNSSAHKPNNTTCINNVAQAIDSKNPLDFVCLQEASQFTTLKQVSTVLQNMNYTHSFAGSDMVTCWHKKYGQPNQIIKSKFVGGRPFHILVFNNIAIINVHSGHEYHKGQKINQHFPVVKSVLAAQLPPAILVPNFHVIMAGDFNYEIWHGITVGPLKFNKYLPQQKVATCCVNQHPAGGKTHKLKYDHILSNRASRPNIDFSAVWYQKPASDHKPVFAKITV